MRVLTQVQAAVAAGCIVAMGLAVIQPAAAQSPGFEWQIASPESQGMSRERLEALRAVMEKKKTKALLVIRNDKIVYEWYSPDHGPKVKHGTASLAKALVGGLSLAVAMTDGQIGLDDRAAKFVAEWSGDPRKSLITVRQLGSHTSGMSDSTTPGVKHEDQPSWMGDFWKRLDPPNDPFSIARDRAPLLFDPGQKLQYSNPGIGMLTYCVTAAIREGQHKDVRTLLRERVMRPIGAPDDEWTCGYGKTYMVNGLPLVGSWGGGSYTARTTARVGRLMLHEGDWDGRRIMSREAVRQTTGSAGLPGACGMGWWTNAAGRYSGIPRDAYWGAGAGDQVLMVVPSLNLIIVRNGQTLEPGADEEPVRQDDVFTQYHDYRARILFEPVVAAVMNGGPTARDGASTTTTKESGKLAVTRGDQTITVISSSLGRSCRETTWLRAAGGAPGHAGAESAELGRQQGAGHHQRAKRDDQHDRINVHAGFLRRLIS